MKLREISATASSESNGNQARKSPPELKTGWAGADAAEASPQRFVHVQPGFDWSAADCYLFDIDGTLLNSRDAVHYHAFHSAVAQVFGLDFRIDGVPVHGNTDVGILRAYLEMAEVPEGDWQPRLPEVLELMSVEVERNAAHLRPEICPSVLNLIQQLSADGKLLGVASGNLERVGWAKLRACGLREYFAFGAFSGRLEKRDDVIAYGVEEARKVLGEDAIVSVVGDTPADIHSAHANGISAIAVATGIYSSEELLAHHPEMCISCCEALLRS
ncbi:MAG TPA: HAD family hydrolase [Terriglobales bacterium]|nr:HAD family hydrolase [Terriglobales bacterium]